MASAHQRLNSIGVKLEPHPLLAKHPTTFAAKLEQFIYKHRHHINLVHYAMFAFFLLLIIVPLFTEAPHHGSTPLNNFTEFSLFMMWGVWFPLVFVSVIATGRSWCGLFCPMGAASEWANKKGLKRKIPDWLRWEGTPIVTFVIVTILGQTLDVRDDVISMAYLFLLLLAAAVVIGFFFGKKKRAWCRHVCPIGLLLGVFSRIGATQFSPKHPRPGKEAYTEQGVCPTMIAVSQKHESRHCIECFRCVKPTSPGGLFVHFRKPGTEIINIRNSNPNFSEIIYLFLAIGLAVGGFLWLITPDYQWLQEKLGGWFIHHGHYWVGDHGTALLMNVNTAARQAYSWLDFFSIVSYMLLWMLASLTALSGATLLTSWQLKRITKSQTIKYYFTVLGYQFMPVAMVSIVIGLGAQLFSTLTVFGVTHTVVASIKLALLVASALWSIYLGIKLIKPYQLTSFQQCRLLLPCIIADCLIVLAWWPAIINT